MTIDIPGPTSHSYFSQRLRLHYVDWGNTDAPPLLLVHGGRDHCRNWDWVAEVLRDDWHIIAPDLRGHGDSQWMIGGSYGLSDYVYDIAQLIHQTKHQPITIIGHSLGGAISLQFTALFPDMVQKPRRHRRTGLAARAGRGTGKRSGGGAYLRVDRIHAQYRRPGGAPISDNRRSVPAHAGS